jgi:O-antigen ligase
VLVCAATVLLLLQLFGGTVGGRIDAYGLGDPGRLSAWRSTLKIIADNPWFGTGLGTFAYAFPPYRSGDISMWGRWDIAHSTPLELASDLGIPLAVIIAVAWIAALILLARVLFGRRSVLTLPLSALAVSMIGLLHSLIDFSLQIAGYSIVVFALLGLGLSQAVLVSGRRGDSPLIEPGRAGVSVNSHRQPDT